MTAPLPADLVARVHSLSPTEKLQLIGHLWDDLSREPENIPVHDWQKEELDRRARNSVITADEFMSRMRQRGNH
jgi:putative addiction module component (TIGR02574 family)